MNPPRAILKPCDQPGSASVEDGVVILDGPDGVAVAMTPEAARRTAESLRKAAAEALNARQEPRPDGEPGARDPR